MARLPYLDPEDLAPDDQALLSRDINLNRILAHSPNAARAFGRLGNFIRHKSTLDGRLRELAILQVGWLARSPYEWSHHVKIGYDFAVTDDDIEALKVESAGGTSELGSLERNVLLAAREIYHDLAVGDPTWDRLAAELSDEHAVDLVVTIAFYCAVVRFLATMQMDVEESYQIHLDRHPLPDGPTTPFERRHDIRIAAPAGDVLDYVSNPQSWREWMPATHDMDSPDRPMSAGETFCEQWVTRGGPVTLEWAVTERIDGQLWVAETATAFTGPIVARYEVETLGDAECRYHRIIVNPARPKPPTPEMVARMDTEAAICLANIKRNLEG